MMDKNAYFTSADGQSGFEVRWAKVEEWKPAMTMIWKTFLEFDSRDYTDEGVRNFFEFITDDDLYRSFLNGAYQLMVALDGERIVGAASIRNGNHLSLLFVDGEYHKRGIGRTLLNRLCRYLELEEGEKYMSLKAAPCALGFYRKLGFIAVKPEEEIAGIRVTPMEKFF